MAAAPSTQKVKLTFARRGFPLLPRVDLFATDSFLFNVQTTALRLLWLLGGFLRGMLLLTSDLLLVTTRTFRLLHFLVHNCS